MKILKNSMASPILFSNPSKSFSLWIVLRGVQFSVLSTYRSLQNYQLVWSIIPQLVSMMKLSLSLYFFINGPIYLTNWMIISLNYLFGFKINNCDLIDNLQYISLNFNLLIVIIGYLRHFDVINFDQFFMENLKFIDLINNTKFYHNLRALPNQMNDFKSFKQRYFKFYCYCLLIFILVHFPNTISTLLLSLASFQIFVSKIGTLPSILLISSLNLISPIYTFKILSCFYGCELLAQDLLTPFFNKIALTNYEKNQWLKSREGVLFGFCLINYCLIHFYPHFSFLLYISGQSNMAYLLTKITDQPPNAPQKLINWTHSQLVWNDCDMVNGEFVNDPFIGLPGWFLFT